MIVAAVATFDAPKAGPPTMTPRATTTRPRKTRRQLLSLPVAAAAIAAGIRCGGDPQPGIVVPAPTPTIDPDDTATPKAGGTLRVLFCDSAGSLDIHRIGSSMEAYAWQWLGSFLMRQRAEFPFSVEPDIAVGMPEMPGDGSLVIFKLNPAARFHPRAPTNGRTVTAADVKATFDRIRGLGAGSPRAGFYAFVDSIQAPDAATLQFKLKTPRADLLQIMSDQFDIIIPRELAAMADPFATGADVVGSGPFEAESFDSRRIKLVRRRDGPWGPNTGWLVSCDILLAPHEGTRANALLDKNADVTHLPGVVAEVFRNRPDFTVSSAAQSARHVLFVNHTGVRYKDPRYRQALWRAVDRAAFYGTYGDGLPSGPVSPAAARWALTPAELAVLPGFGNRAAELNQAVALLSAAGAPPDGYEETLITSAAAGLPELAHRLAEGLAEANIHLRIVELPGDYKALQARLASGDFTLALGVSIAGPYPDAQLYPYHHSRSGGANYGKYVNVTLDAKLDRQRATLDAGQRIALVAEIQHELIVNPGPIWIGSPTETRVTGKRVHGIRALPFLPGYDDAERGWVSSGP